MISVSQPKSLRMTLFLALIAVSSLPANAKSDPDESPLFLNQSVLNVRIEGPISALVQDRSETDYLEGKFSYTDDTGVTHPLDLKFRARGNYRLQKRTCWFPPVRLNFKKKQVKETEFAGQDILKLVTHCSLSSTRAEQDVVKEYLAYKILQQVTPYSFRTRLLKITWVDTDKGNAISEKYGFVIEHKSQLAKRLGVDIATFNSTSHTTINNKQSSIAAVFEYLIGNTDFSFSKAPPGESCCHNAILVSMNDGKFMPIPYDFDLAGIVNTAYAKPSRNLKIPNVRVRLYRGNCTVTPEVRSTLALFMDNKEAILRLVRDQEGLTDATRKDTFEYVEKFYQDISNPKVLAKQRFFRECS